VSAARAESRLVVVAGPVIDLPEIRLIGRDTRRRYRNCTGRCGRGCDGSQRQCRRAHMVDKNFFMVTSFDPFSLGYVSWRHEASQSGDEPKANIFTKSM
jgi:hypothetical protein